MSNAEPLYLATATLVPHRDPIGADYWRSLVDAAAGAGFDGIEYWVRHHDGAVADGMSSDEFLEYARDRGMAMIAAEFSDMWANPDRQAVAEANAHLIDLTKRSGAFTINTVARQLPSFEDAATGLGHLCDLAAEEGLKISLEIVPFGGVTDIGTAARFLEAVDRDNLGLCMDAWHWTRQTGGPDLATLRTIPGEKIHVFQLDDATAEASDDLLVETMTGRLLPGEGVADIEGLLGVFDEIGATPAMVTEVYLRPLALLDPAENARRQYETATAVLAAHRASKAG
jgi:sugar phosphate isomerase/epimerase